MKKLFFTLLIGFSISTFYAQKSSPVMGDAASLIDLLKKDYNIVNPDTRDEEINTDRGKVIAIFKSYLEDGKKATLTITADNVLKNAYQSYSECQQTLNATLKLNTNISSGKEINAAKKTILRLQSALTTSKKEYYGLKYDFDLNEITKLETAYSQNSYLLNILGKFKSKYDALKTNNIDSFAEKNDYSSIQKSLPFLGGDMAFETLIDGLSRFLAKRIKEELTIHAIDKIKNYLENPTPENYCDELLVLLPTTTNYLKTFEADRLLNFTDEIKQYIEQDLNDMLTNAVNLKNTPRLKSYIEKNPDLEFAFEGLEIIPQLSKIKSPVDYFEILENSRTLNLWKEDNSNHTKYNIAQSIKLASMLAYSMTVVDNNETKFASVDFLSNYGNEPNFYFLYFGMLHQQNIKYFNINFYKPYLTITSFYPVIFMSVSNVDFDINAMMTKIPPNLVNKTNDNFKFLKSNLIAVVQNAEKIYSQSLLLKKKKKNNEEIKYNEVHIFINDIIDFSEELVKTADLLTNNKYKIINTDLTEITLKEKVQPYFNTAKIANNIMLDLHEKKYANAIIKAVEIPLSYNTQTSAKNYSLESIKSTIENQKDLGKMKNLFKIDQSKSDAVNGPLIKNMETDFVFLALKFSDNKKNKETKEIVKCIEALNKAIQAKQSDNNAIVKEYKNLKDVFKKNYSEILNHYGVNIDYFTTQMKSKLNTSIQNEKVTKYLEKKIDEYAKEIFSKQILNEKIVITFPKELSDFLNEFDSQYSASNLKISDNKAIKLIHFINDISQSKDAEEVEKAIEAFALPVGSSSLKEKASTYVSINAFPGILIGNEHSSLYENKDSFAVGFTAPIGFYLQFNKNNNKLRTWGAFIPIIDIAAPVRLRLDDNVTTENLPDFSFKDIFSPGLYVTYGFPKSPFALNFGIQSGPKLRNISEDGGATFKDVDSYRVSLGVVVDIPLFTLASKYKD